MTTLEMEIEVKAYVRLQNWLMDYYMRNQKPAPDELKEQKRKEIRMEVIREEKSHIIRTIEEILN